MHEQERKRVWELRYDCMKLMPHQLPMLLTCVEWNDQKEVCCGELVSPFFNKTFIKEIYVFL